MAEFNSFDGTKIAYERDGDGFAVLLVHGFATDGYINWIRPGVVDALVGAGRSVITMDLRGHGASDKPHDPAAYAGDAMVRDVRGLIDHLGLDRLDVAGYSMGAWTALRLIGDEPRVRRAVLGGIGGAMLGREPQRSGGIADAMLTDDKRSIDNPIAKSFRDFADLTGADKQALAAIQRSERFGPPDASELSSIAIPVLVLCGDNDPLAGDPQTLADRLGNARAVVVGGSHLNVVNNTAFHHAMLEFLTEGEG